MSGIFFYSILIFILLSIFVPSIYNYAYSCFIGRIVLVLLIIYFSKYNILLGLLFVAIIIVTSLPLYEGFLAGGDMPKKNLLVTSNTSIKDKNAYNQVSYYFKKYFCEKDASGNVGSGPNRKKLQRWDNILSSVESQNRPTPTCPSGWYYEPSPSDQCIQLCDNPNQTRYPDSSCMCNSGGYNQNCSSGFKCVSNKCKKTLPGSATYEPRPSPSCPTGWYKDGKECLQECSRKDQTRHSDGTCICNQGGFNQDCGPGFACVSDRCRKVNSGANIDSINVALSSKKLQESICNPDTSQYYRNYGDNFRQNISNGMFSGRALFQMTDGCSVKAIDENNFCGFWAAIGECSRNPDYMLNKCKASCNRIKGETSTHTDQVYNMDSCLPNNIKSNFCRDPSVRSLISSAQNMSNNTRLDPYLQQDGQWTINMYNQVCN